MMPLMKTNFTLQTFPLSGTAIHIPPDGNDAVFRGDHLKSRLQQLPNGLLLGAFQIARAVDAHSNVWEMHPVGDEILVMVTGALEVEYADDSHRGTCSLGTGEAMVMPRGFWHRLALREPGLLLTLTPLQGTLHSDKPGDAQ
jgi:mannose-6-phosphate isomerase-like protein (cupin superfamily)